MIFRRSYSFTTKYTREELRERIEGKHLDIHGLDFEVMDKGGMLKIIPHTELAEEKVYTLPITHLVCSDKADGSLKLKLKFKPRRIDIGGPTIALFFIFFITVAGIVMYMSGEEDYTKAAIGMIGFGIAMLIFFAIRMNQGYFDYIRKIKAWVKSKI